MAEFYNRPPAVANDFGFSIFDFGLKKKATEHTELTERIQTTAQSFILPLRTFAPFAVPNRFRLNRNGRKGPQGKTKSPSHQPLGDLGALSGYFFSSSSSRSPIP